GLDVLERAAPPEAELAIAGAGPERPARGRLLGELRGAARDDLFAAADVLVVPSVDQAGRTEGAPTVVLEALAAGVPLVASHLPGIRALAGPAALYAPPGDAVSLGTAIARALADRGAERITLGHSRAAARSWDALGPTF